MSVGWKDFFLWKWIIFCVNRSHSISRFAALAFQEIVVCCNLKNVLCHNESTKYDCDDWIKQNLCFLFEIWVEFECIWELYIWNVHSLFTVCKKNLNQMSYVGYSFNKNVSENNKSWFKPFLIVFAPTWREIGLFVCKLIENLFLPWKSKETNMTN